MNVTLQSIAEKLDVSTATVSRSLRHDRLIHPKTRARVNEMALRMGYIERSRRPRAKTEGGTLGFLLRMDTIADAKHDPNIMRMMEGVMSGADTMGLLLNMHGMRFGDERHMAEDESAVPPMIRDHVCRAVIVQGDFHERDIAFLARHMPVVCLNRTYRGLAVDSVVADDVEGVRDLVECLIGLGHRRLAWVNDYYDVSFFQARQSGFIQGCLGSKLPLHEQRFFGTEIFNGRALVEHSLIEAVKDGVTGMVCANDFVARQVVQALERASISVPVDVSVTGFDALPSASEALQITSFDPNFFEMGRAAVRLAAQHEESYASPPTLLSLRGKVVDGKSTAAVRQ